MNTQISSKLAALVVALMMNGLILGGVAYLFDGSKAHAASDSSLAHRPAAVNDAAHDVV
jgi:hypothetical protein